VLTRLPFSVSSLCIVLVLSRVTLHLAAAHKLYPLRVRVVNVITGDVDWEPVAYIPIVRKQKEPSSDVRARARRNAILQRVLYLAFRTAIAASRIGVKVEMHGRTLVAFPRVLLYLGDQPEEKAVLCLKGGTCKFPCSCCLVAAEVAGSPAALEAADRCAVEGLRHQIEAETLERRRCNPERLAELEALGSAHSRVPALAAMFGLSTDPFLLYRIVGFDTLHVREWLSLSSLRFCTCSLLPIALVDEYSPADTPLFSDMPLPDVSWVPTTQVLDLGVTRLLVHRLVRVFPHICEGHYPLCETIAATYRAANRRLEFLGRRCKASRLPPGYVHGLPMMFDVVFSLACCRG